jgi:hypothetical protein
MKAENYKSVVLVAREAAVEAMRRDVSGHGEDSSVQRALVDARRESAERDFLTRIGSHLSRGELSAVSTLNGAPYNPRMGGTLPTDAMWLLSPEQEVKALELLGREAPDTRPVFTTLARPVEVPALLRVLPADTAILTRADFGGISSTANARVGEYVEYLDDIMRRQAEGIFTVCEAAQLLVDSQPGADIRRMLDKMHQAYRDGKLTVRDPGDKLPKRIVDRYRDHLDVVTVADVDAWLDAEGAGYRFPSTSSAPCSDAAREEEDSGPSAHPQEIGPSLSTDDVCKVFHGLGMSQSEWRTALTKNRPKWLLNCRASLGRPGANPVQGRWHPLEIAIALVTGLSRKAGAVPALKLDAAFSRNPVLRPFTEAWKGVRRDHPAWGD